MENKINFRFLLDDTKEKTRVSHYEFAKEVGIHYTTISDYYNGKKKPSDKHRKLIAEYFFLDAKDIFYPADNEVTILDVKKDCKAEVKFWRDKFYEVLYKLKSTNAQLGEIRGTLKDISKILSVQLLDIDTYNLDIYKNVDYKPEKEVK